MEKAYKFRFYPTKTQIKILNSTFGCVRYVYNHFLDLKQKLQKKLKKLLKMEVLMVCQQNMKLIKNMVAHL